MKSLVSLNILSILFFSLLSLVTDFINYLFFIPLNFILIIAIFYTKKIGNVSLYYYTLICSIFLILSYIYFQEIRFHMDGFTKPYEYSRQVFVDIYILFAYIIHIFIVITVNITYSPFKNSYIFDTQKQVKSLTKYQYNKFDLYLFFSLFVVSALHLIMFNFNIGITGIQPEILPYKLTGIMYYTSKLFFPLLVGYFFIKSYKSFLSLSTLICISIIISILTSSRGASIVYLIPIIIYAFFQKKKLLLIFSLFFSGIIFFIATAIRRISHVVLDGTPTVVKENINLENFLNLINNGENIFYNIMINLINLITRIESFENMLRGYFYNINNVDGRTSWDLVLSFFNFSSKKFNYDQHHMEWIGYTNPSGWYNGGSLISESFIVLNESIFLFVLYSILTGLFILIFNFVQYKLFTYRADKLIIHFSSFLLVGLLITNRGHFELYLGIIFLLILPYSSKIISRIKI